METRGCAGHTGSGQHRHLQQDTEELSQMVQNMWRPCLHGASRLGAHGRVWGDHPGVSVPRRHSCELSRDGTTHQRRFAEDEGRPEGNGWFRHHRTGITAASRYLRGLQILCSGTSATYGKGRCKRLLRSAVQTISRTGLRDRAPSQVKGESVLDVLAKLMAAARRQGKTGQHPAYSVDNEIRRSVSVETPTKCRLPGAESRPLSDGSGSQADLVIVPPHARSGETGVNRVSPVATSFSTPLASANSSQ